MIGCSFKVVVPQPTLLVILLRIVIVKTHLKGVPHVIWFQLLADSVNQQPQLFPVRSNVIQHHPQRQSPHPQQQLRQPVIHAPEFVLEVQGVRDCVSTGTMKLVLLGF